VRSWNEFLAKTPDPNVVQLISFVYSDPHLQDIVGRFDSKLKTQIEEERATQAPEAAAAPEAEPVLLDPIDPPMEAMR
jgi:hypothetical protein